MARKGPCSGAICHSASGNLLVASRSSRNTSGSRTPTDSTYSYRVSVSGVGRTKLFMEVPRVLARPAGAGGSSGPFGPSGSTPPIRLEQALGELLQRVGHRVRGRCFLTGLKPVHRAALVVEVGPVHLPAPARADD